MRGPLNRVADYRVKEMHWLWSPGGGKTTGIEGAVQWKACNQPSNMLLVGQKSDTAARWMETRFLPSMRKNPAISHLLPSAQGNDRHKIRKSTVIFNDGFYFEAGGSAESNLQEKSMPFVILEEAWRLSMHPGRIQQAKQRTHDKWDSKILYVGQAGETHTDAELDDSLADLYREWLRTDQADFCFCCPECGTVQPFKWGQMKWEKFEDEDSGNIDWSATAETVRLACCDEKCGAEWHDTTNNRRMLSESALDHPATMDGYVSQVTDSAEEGFFGFHANAMCYWRIPWLKLVKEFVKAMDAKSRGDLSLLQVFIQQRLAEFWTPVMFEEQHELEQGGYTIQDYENGELVDGEVGRAIGVDVQMTDTWFTIGAYQGDGKLKILQCGQCHTFEEIEELRQKYKVNPAAVLVDMQFKRNFVIEQCAKYKWTPYEGVSATSLPYRKKNGVVRAPYSNTFRATSGSGKSCKGIKLCVNPLKDVVADMRAGRIGGLLAPDDVTPELSQHLNAEVKRKVISGREKQEREMWVKLGKRPNHMLDNVMALAGYGMIRGFIRMFTDYKEKEEVEED